MKFLKTVHVTAFAQVDMKNATVKVKSLSAEIEVKIGAGNLTWSEKRPIEYTLDRGLLDEVREGDQTPMDVKMDFVMEYTTGDIQDAIKGNGTHQSVDPDACRPYACDIEVTLTPDCSGGGRIITLPDFRYEQFDYDVKAGTVSCTGKCNATEAIFTGLGGTTTN